MEPDRLRDLTRFYDLLAILSQTLGGPRRLADCSGRFGWPKQGVYFFMEDGETRRDSGTGPRIVRVGTHAVNATSQTRLWTRLAQHRGVTSSGGGNHRGSVFRKLVGSALIVRDGLNCQSWGIGASAPAAVREAEAGLERQVSRVIGGMPFLWLPVGDQGGRAVMRDSIERNAIALLSNFEREPIDPPGASWLGRLCPRPRVPASGLWNQNYVEGRPGARLSR